ncbi:DUF4253 domain-containing protein [Massilia sp. G4R7]|uniref:DUF4253 domain-containing protein n=1 Tax=Massilia phyllostachyos TaxID=2898585 RepID=A0ABS8QBI2_9BURK|nr:DUF4253 domain-containing protein [Massilia phyllostachyos]MCD2518311.1 DUF4253 domain-containing protein [Massilia phyllostachyos]
MNLFRIARSIALFFMVLAGASCRAEPSKPLEQASTLLQRISGAHVRPYSTRDFGRDRYDGAISALVDETRAEAMLIALRNELPAGLVAFIGTTRSLTKPSARGVELVVGKGSGPLDILHIAQTDAVNYNMNNEDLKRRLARWHEAYGIDIWQAETDTIQLRFTRMPSNVQSFAKEVYKFCPDIVDQGAGSQKALEQDIQKRKGLYLWWD